MRELGDVQAARDEMARDGDQVLDQVVEGQQVA